MNNFLATPIPPETIIEPVIALELSVVELTEIVLLTVVAPDTFNIPFKKVSFAIPSPPEITRDPVFDVVEFVVLVIDIVPENVADVPVIAPIVVLFKVVVPAVFTIPENVAIPETFKIPFKKVSLLTPRPPAAIIDPVIDDALFVVLVIVAIPVIEIAAKLETPVTFKVDPRKVSFATPKPPDTISEPVIEFVEFVVFVIDTIPLAPIELALIPPNVELFVTLRLPFKKVSFETPSPPLITRDPVIEFVEFVVFVMDTIPETESPVNVPTEVI